MRNCVRNERLRPAARFAALEERGRRAWLVCAALAFVVQAAGAEIRLGYFPNLTHAQALFARATGCFETNINARIHWTAFNAGPTAVEALFAGEIDAAYLGPNPAINGYLRSKGAEFVIVAGAASGGAALVVREGAGISSDADFNGKTVASPQLGNTQDVAARVWLGARGYRLKDRGGTVSLIPLTSADQLTMFRKQQIDAAWTVEPWVSRLELEAGGRLFLNERELWPGGRYITTHLVVTRDFLRAQPDVVKRLLRAHVETTQAINGNKSAAGRVLNEQIKRETSRALREDVIEQAMKRVEFTWDPVADSLQHAAEAAHKVGFIRRPPDLRGIYHLALLNEILREKGIPPVSEQTAGP